MRLLAYTETHGIDCAHHPDGGWTLDFHMVHNPEIPIRLLNDQI